MQASLPLRDRLRELRARTERTLGAVRGTSSPADYHRYLMLLYGFVEPLERALLAADGGQLPVKLTARKKTNLLERDLALLAPHVPLAAYPKASVLPPLDNLPRSIGALAVLDADTWLANDIKQQLPPALTTRAHAFIDAYANPTQALAPLESYAAYATPEELAQLFANLDATYAAFERWLSDESSRNAA